MRKQEMIKRLKDALTSWDNCSPELKEKARLFQESWIIPNIKFVLSELEKK